MIRALIADDHEVVRAGFAALLETQPDFTVLGTAADGAEAVRRSAAAGRRPDGHPDAGHGRHRGHQAAGVRAPRAARAGPDHVRPRRVRVRRAAGWRQRLPAQGRHRGAAVRRGAGHRGRGRAARAHRHQEAHRRVCPSAAPSRARRAALRRAHPAGDRSAAADRRGTVQPGNSRTSRGHRRDGEDARQPRPEQAGAA